MLDYLRIVLAVRIGRDERGASAVEYGLLISGVAALIVVIILAFGDNVKDLFDDTCDTVNGASTSGCATD